MSTAKNRPIFLIGLINNLGFLLLFMHSSFNPEIVYAGFGVSILNLVVYKIISGFELGDAYMYLMVSMLVSIGLLMMFRLDIYRGFLQLQWFIIGVAVMFAVYVIYRLIKKWDSLAPLYMIATFVLFAVTLIFGDTINGSRNWITFGSKSVQPSEIIKILYVFTLACFMSGDAENKKRKIMKKDLVLMAYVYMCLGFLVLQREWGTTVLFMLVYFVMMFLYNTPKRFLFANILMTAIVLVLGYFATSHISSRVNVWLDPWADPTGKGYQVTQSLIAIASGGFFGSGLGAGNPYLIPEVHSDFIFAAICEEMGMFMGIAIILLYFIFSYRGFKVALITKNSFDKALSLGLVTCFGFQTFIIVGGVIKFIPLTGITLPFVSYGGSSMTSCFIILGLLTAISHNNT